MKNIIQLILVTILLVSCNNLDKKDKKEAIKINIQGTWKLVYGEVKENDSIKVKDLSKADFIKIINKTHFAFFNQPKKNTEGFYGGGGSYTLEKNNYKETLNYISVDAIRGHVFPFTVKITGDTLIQYGLEEVKEAGIHRDIIEKYIRIK
ncbi:hypothetical protein BA195_13035 [Tenacibaculum soleae]|uniref:Lipocalin-like domain-containing protein n=1 Tax=Tenacibaculum soleae TaxID=447689 RepID=A0A1B9XWH5_9FLAO|nr:hypothetical protein [Tenacibaculum soleae]OCK41902.1 hypothetical protein BA195_13035 [Tenacibaculum soleae]